MASDVERRVGFGEGAREASPAMASDLDRRAGLGEGFRERLALLGQEYERLDAENRSLREQLSALAGGAERASDKAEAQEADALVDDAEATWEADGLPEAEVHMAWNVDGLIEADRELPERLLEFRHDQVHMMSPSPGSVTSRQAITPPLPPPTMGGVHGNSGPIQGWSSLDDRAADNSPVSDNFRRSATARRLSMPKAKTHDGLTGVIAGGGGNNTVKPAIFKKPVSTGRDSVSARSSLSSGTPKPMLRGFMRRSMSRLGVLTGERSDGAWSDDMGYKEEILRRPVFANANDMKEKVRQQISKEPYSVCDYYKTEGVFQAIAKSQIFDHCSLAVIALNGIWIAVDADYNTEELVVNSDLPFQIAEHFFCFCFTMELFVRFMAFYNKRDCLRDMWFCFDLGLVVLTISETWLLSIIILLSPNDVKPGHGWGNTSVLRVFRLLRLTRMVRMAKILRAVPELMILVKGMVSATRCVSLMLALLAVVLYVFSVTFHQLLKGTPTGNQYFASVLAGMHTLWIKGALLDDVSDIVYAMEKESVFCMLLLDVFLLIATVTVMNMLIGVLCEVVSAVAAAEREDVAVKFAKSKLQRIFDDVLDLDGSQTLSKDEFVKILENKEATRTMHDLDVDVVGLVDFADVIFTQDPEDDKYDKELTFPDLMEVIVAFRGSNTATVKDIENLRKLITQTIVRCENRVARVEADALRDGVGQCKSEALVQNEVRRMTLGSGGYGAARGSNMGSMSKAAVPSNMLATAHPHPHPVGYVESK